MRHPKLAWLLSGLSVLVLSHCECEPELQRVAPKIEIADPQDPAKSLCAEAGIRDCAYDFGEVPISQGRFLKFLLKNPSPVDLLIEDISFATGGNPAFTLSGEPPKVVYAADGAVGQEVTVRFVPEVAGEVTANLVIQSDAANLNPDEDVVIALKGTGLDLGQPELVISPAECNFGEVGVGVTAFCDLALENIGERDLEIPTVGFSPDTPLAVFGASSVLAVPLFIAPGTGISVRLYATPNQTGETSGAFVMTSNDPNRSDASVPMRVTGAQAPTAIAEVASVNGTSVSSASPQVRPLDDVVLTGVNSVAGTPGGSIVAYQWQIVQKPPESSAQLTTPNQMTTQFSFSSAAGQVRGIDVAGTFVVRLTVTDDNGAVSTNDARVTLNAVPSEALWVQLTWDEGVNDFDLHLLRSGANYCSNDTCYWENCKATSPLRPNWDGVFGASAGDPTLDVDDLSGYGPENINIDAPVDDTYKISVHFFSGSRAANATIKVFINGALRAEYTRQLADDGDVWEVAEVEWGNGSAIVTPVDAYLADAGLDC